MGRVQKKVTQTKGAQKPAQCTDTDPGRMVTLASIITTDCAKCIATEPNAASILGRAGATPLAVVDVNRKGNKRLASSEATVLEFCVERQLSGEPANGPRMRTVHEYRVDSD